MSQGHRGQLGVMPKAIVIRWEDSKGQRGHLGVMAETIIVKVKVKVQVI